MVRKFIIPLLLFAALVLAACGDDTENDNTEGASTENEVDESDIYRKFSILYNCIHAKCRLQTYHKSMTITFRF